MSSNRKTTPEQQKTLKELWERDKERASLFNISRLNELNLSVDELILETIDNIRAGLQYPNDAGIEILYGGEQYRSEKFEYCKEKIISVTKRDHKEFLKISVCYPNHQKGKDQLIFLKEEQELLDASAELLSLKLHQKKTRLELEQSLKMYEHVTEATSDAIWDYDPKSTILFWGEGFKTLFGYEKGPSKKGIKRWTEKIHPDDVDRIMKNVDEFMAGTMDRWDEEYRFKKADGNYAYVRDKAIVVTGEDGSLERIIGAMEDITTKKEEVQQLKLMESVVVNTKDAVLITKAEPMDAPHGPEIVYVNKAYEKMSGYSREELIGKTPRIFHGPHTDYDALKEFGKKIRKFKPAEVETINYKKNGEEYWVQFSVSPVADEKGQFTHWIAVERDITERKLKELQKSLSTDISVAFNVKNDLTDALDVTLNSIQSVKQFALAEFWLVDDHKQEIRLETYLMNDGSMKLFYRQTENVTVFKKGEGMPGKTWKKEKELFWRNLDSRKTFHRNAAAKKVGIKTAFSFPLIRDGQVLGVLLLGLKEDLKQESFFIPLFKDLAVQLGLEISRKKLEYELKMIFNSAPDIICIAGFDGYFKKVNPAMCEMLGYSEHELLTNPFIDFTHPADIKKTRNELAALRNEKGSFKFENRYITKTGKVVWLSWTTKPLYHKKITFSVAKDVTEQKELEDLLDQANRLAKIGSWEIDLVKENVYMSEITKEIHELDPDTEPDLEEAIHFYEEGVSRNKIQEAVKNAVEHGQPYDLELQLRTAKGNLRWVRTIGDPEFVDGKCVRIYGSFQNIDDRKKSEAQIFEKNRQLDVLAMFNGRVIKYDDWEKAFQESLPELAEVVNADRAYYFENHEDPESGEKLTSMKLEWVDENISAQLHRPEHKNVPFKAIHEFIDPLSKNRLVSTIVSEIEDKEFKKLLESQDIKSVLSIPVFAGKDFWGFIGFDDCRKERKWRDDEISFLETISLNLASAIDNEEAGEALQKAYDEKNEIIESIGDGFFAVDNDFTVTYWNQKAEELLSIPKEKVLGKYLWDVFDKEEALESYSQYSKALKKQVALKFEDNYEPIGRWFDINVYPSNKGISVFFKDITERKKADEKLRELNQALEQQAKELAVSNAELEQFAFVASHDLQEPLRMITSFLAQLERKYNDVLDAKGKQYIHFATDGAKRMRQIILDLLDFSRIGRVETKTESVNINEILANEVRYYNRKIKNVDAIVEWKNMPVITAAKGPLQQVFHNLIGNGLKYQSDGNIPKITISAEESDTHWTFSVQDNGIGINPDYKEKVFNIFQRLHNRDEFEGTGVGLAICKKVVEEHGGEIWVESEEGKGSTFHFTIEKIQN
jgi:PAS domain S-box-containing protein